MSGLGHFLHGLMHIESLKEKVNFSRVYCLFLALSNSYLIDELCPKKRKKEQMIHKLIYFPDNFLKIIIM